MIQGEDEIIWMTLWRVSEDGDIAKVQAYEDEDSIIFKDDDERYDYDDPRHVHVDDLAEGNGVFDNEAEAKAYTIRLLEQKIHDYQLKLGRLRATNTAIG